MSHEVCRAWGTLRGCHHDDCKYIHEGRQGDAARARVAAKGAEPCKGWSSDTGCRYGADCPYIHSGRGKLYVEKTAEEKANEECNNWKSTKGCRAGDMCPYKHVGPTGKFVAAAAAAAAPAAANTCGGGGGGGRRRGGRGSGPAKPVVPEKTVEEKGNEECNNWKSDKGCWRGDRCPYKHVGKTGNINPEKPEPRSRRRAPAAAAAAPADDSKPSQCVFFNTPQGCYQGVNCPFSHVRDHNNNNNNYHHHHHHNQHNASSARDARREAVRARLRGRHRISARSYGSAPASQRLKYARPLDDWRMPAEIADLLPDTKEEVEDKDIAFAAQGPSYSLLRRTGAPLMTATDQLLKLSDGALHPASAELNVIAHDICRERLHAMLFVEEAKCIVDLLSFAKTGVVIERRHGRNNEFVVPAEGVSEKRPSVLRGDIIYCSITNSGHWDAGFVHFVEMDRLVVNFSPFSNVARFYNSYEGITFDVKYVMDESRTQWRMMHRAIDEGVFLTAEFGRRHEGGPVLVSKELVQHSLHHLRITNSERLPELNERQCEAVESACTQGGLRAFFGPPGTGKTSTLVATCATLLDTDKFGAVRILIACPSNNAADVVVERLAQYDLFKNGKKKMKRLHALSRSEKDVSDLVKKYSDLDGKGGFSFLQDRTGQNSPAFIVWEQDVVVATLATTGKLYGLGVPNNTFTHVFVDEAGQATEAQLMLATTFVCPNRTSLILAGDPRQLGPVIHSGPCKEAGMGVSPLERLCAALPDRTTLLINNYRSHPSILKIVNVAYQDRLIAARTENPAKQFRTNFSGGLLSTENPPVFLPRGWNEPLLFCHVEGEEARVKDSPSWKNEQEVKVVVGIVKQLINEKKEHPRDIVVLTPYLLQRQTIEQRLFAMCFRTGEIRIPPDCLPSNNNNDAPPSFLSSATSFLSSFVGGGGGAGAATATATPTPVKKRCPIEVCTVEAFQGKERRIVIVSCVRSRETHVGQDVRNHLGFMAQPQRSNVALSRAQDFLVVIGNAKLLLSDGLRDAAAQQAPPSSSSSSSARRPVGRGGGSGVIVDTDDEGDDKKHSSSPPPPSSPSLTPVGTGAWNQVLMRFKQMNAISNVHNPMTPVHDLFNDALSMLRDSGSPMGSRHASSARNREASAAADGADGEEERETAPLSSLE